MGEEGEEVCTFTPLRSETKLVTMFGRGFFLSLLTQSKLAKGSCDGPSKVFFPWFLSLNFLLLLSLQKKKKDVERKAQELD